MNASPITRFAGAFDWLSNFYPASVVFDGVTYPTVENAYQAAKYPPDYRKAFEVCAPGHAKRLGRVVVPPADWATNKTETMWLLLQQKFAPGTPLAAALLSTENCHIEEGNHWGDRFWGTSGGIGQNRLGKMLMAQREALR